MTNPLPAESQAPMPGTREVPVEAIEAIIERLDRAMRGIPLGSHSEGLDNVYLDICVAWAHARHALRGTFSQAPLVDLMLEPAPAAAVLRLAASPDLTPCPGCTGRCGQCR